MKKYIQYPPSSPSHYVKPVSEVGGRSRPTAAPSTTPSNDCNEMVLDLSGKPGNSTVAMVAGQKWTNEQEAALDLTSYGKQSATSGQAEALDLSKPSTPRPHHAHSQSYSSPDLIYQSQQPLQAPAALNPSRSLASQYSLLQAALNSGQSIAAFQAGKLAFPESRPQIFGRGASLMDGGSRTIRPFSSVASHRNSTVAVVQGVHKPVAITTPQPHNSSGNTTTQSTSQSSVTATIPNQSTANSSQSCSISQSGYSSIFQTPPTTPAGLGRGSGTVNQVTGSFLPPGYSKSVDNLVERYIIQTPDGTSHVVGGKNYAHIEPANAYACSQCPKAFKTKAALKLHTTVHKTLAERQYECQICQRRFLHRHHLVVHQRKHSGEKPFQCNACSKTFMAIFLLHKHLRKHVRENSRSSQISTEQLQKLHLKKVTSDGMEGVIGGMAKPVVLDTVTDPVIVSDDEETPTKATVEIGVAEKGMNESQAVVACLDKNVLSEATGTTEVKESLPKKTVINLVSDDLQSYSSALDLLNNAAMKELKESPSEKSEMSTGILNKMILAEAKESSKSELTECGKETAVTDDKPIVDHPNPFPSYTSDDEVELDFETGELKILDKIPDITSEKNYEIDEDKTDTKTAESASNVNEYGEDDIPKLEPQIEITENQIDDLTNSNFKESGSRDENKFEVVDDDSGDHKKSGSDTETLSAESDVPSMDESEETAEHTEKKVDDDALEIPKLEHACGISNDKLSIFESGENSVGDCPAEHVATKRKRRISSKKKSKRAKCELCSKTFYSNHHLLLHMSVHKKNPMLQSLKKAKANQMKVLGFPGKGSVNCSICKKVFKFQKSLNCHMRVHSEKLAQNRRLSKEFRDFVELGPSAPFTRSKRIDIPSGSGGQSQLKNSHDGVKSLDKNLDESSIGITKVESESQESLSQVKKVAKVSDNLDDFPIQFIIGKDKVKRFVCYACDNTYTTKQKLKMHALIHKDNCFLCEICGKSFFRQMTLDKHIATHLLPRPHVCTVCKKSFIHRSSLMRHKVIHEKPSAPSLKQQVADVKFEMKMLDTYTLLKQERIQKLQMQHQIQDLKVGAAGNDQKEDVLDLSMRGKVDEQSHPPVLSLEIPPKVSAAAMNLSPPLITQEICSSKPNIYDPSLRIKEEPMSPNVTQQQPTEPNKVSVKSGEKSRKRVACDVYGPKPPSFHTFLKKSRKTRVYQTSCRVCKESFPNIVALKEHMTVHNVVETHLYECHVCHHRFTQSCSLLRHLKTSCQEKQMKCDPCGKTFQRKNSFEHHMRTQHGGPPNLDGSFYDNRKDEVQIKEDIVDRESDILNNNIKSVDVKPELSQLEESFGIQPQNLRIHIKEENDSDSDARTYLYSEGEIHNPMSDLSDADLSPPRTPAADVLLPNTLQVSPNTMTLNLLSAVCSDIRNAEREQEMRCQELEERQKELETIEILANLKRTRLQNTPPILDAPPVFDTLKNIEQPVAPLHLARYHAQKIDLSRKKGSSKVADIGGSKGSKSSSVTARTNSSSRPFSVNSESEDCQIIDNPEPAGSRHDALPKVLPPADQKSGGKGSSALPQIPTVVLELAAEAERLRRERISRMMQNKIINLQPGKDDLPTVEINTQNLLQELSHVNIPDNRVIQNRLSLLMKAQIPSTAATSTVTSVSSAGIHSTPTAPFTSTSVKSTVARITKPAYSLLQSSLPSSSMSSSSMAASLSHSVSMATTVSPSKPFTVSSASAAMMSAADNMENSPQDLSMKQSVKKVVPSASVSPVPNSSKATVPAPPPPLVPVFHCELCGMLMYSKKELHTHMREHGVSPKSSPGSTPQMSPEHPGIHGNVEQASTSWQEDADKPSTGDSGSSHVDKVIDNDTPQTVKKLAPPTSLDLPIGITAGLSPSKALALAQLSCDSPDLSSPMTSSDLSDTLPSPLTPSSSSSTMAAADLAGMSGPNLDVLRKELRNKIYARRRSQGLEELTVEFKSPEPTEMTDEERKKLNYRRECNRQAAQRSRMRKKDLVDSLLEELHCEEVVNSDLRRKMESLVVEKHSLLKALDSHTCVKTELPSKSDSDTPS